MVDIELHAIPNQTDAFDPATDGVPVSNQSDVSGTGYRKIWETFEPSVSVEVGAAFNLSKAVFFGRVVGLSDPGLVTLTIPPGLPGGACTIYQAAAGQVQILPGGGVTLYNRSGHFKTAGQWAVITLIHLGADNWMLAGDTAA
jgi:hypothetical protein